MDSARHGPDAVVAGVDLGRGSAHDEAGRAVLASFDIDATARRGHLGQVDRRHEEADLLAQRPTQRLARGVGALGGQEGIDFRQVAEGEVAAQLRHDGDVGVGEFARADPVGEAGETIEDRHRLRQLAVGAGRVGAERRRDLEQVLGRHVLVDPRREARAGIELGKLRKRLSGGLFGRGLLCAGECAVVDDDRRRRCVGGSDAGSVLAFGTCVVAGQCSRDRLAAEGAGTVRHGEVEVEQDLLEHHSGG